METTNGTSTAPASNHAPKIPPETALIRATLAMQVGEVRAFPLSMASAWLMQRWISKHSNLQLQVLPDRYLVTKTSEGDNPRGKGIATRLMELAMGEKATFTGPRVATVRNIASTLLKRDQPLRFTVLETGYDECVATRIELSQDDRQQWSRYQFKSLTPGGQFTVPDGQHSGIESMRVSCAYHAKRGGLVFKARLNVDNSITVRCYAQGGMPPKWAMDREHADLQEAIIAATPKPSEPQ